MSNTYILAVLFYGNAVCELHIVIKCSENVSFFSTE
jgi:hypothetical protein